MRCFYISVLVFTSLIGLGQEVRSYEPYLVDGKSWTFEQYNGFNELIGIHSITVVGDTLAFGKSCKKLENSNRPGVCSLSFEEDYKVFDIVSGTSRPLYDFSVQVGDKILFSLEDNEPIETMSVIKDEFIEVHGKKWRRIIFDGGISWIEGIGSESGNGMTLYEAPFGYYSKLLQCCENGNIIFTNEDFYVKPAGVENITVEDTGSQKCIYNLMGQRVANTIPGQIYLYQGKKFIAR